MNGHKMRFPKIYAKIRKNNIGVDRESKGKTATTDNSFCFLCAEYYCARIAC